LNPTHLELIFAKELGILAEASVGPGDKEDPVFRIGMFPTRDGRTSVNKRGPIIGSLRWPGLLFPKWPDHFLMPNDEFTVTCPW
jgi:hypothetical protein